MLVERPRLLISRRIRRGPLGAARMFIGTGPMQTLVFGLDEPPTVTPTLAYVLGRTHPGDRERVARYVESIRTLANSAPIEDLLWLLIKQLASLRA